MNILLYLKDFGQNKYIIINKLKQINNIYVLTENQIIQTKNSKKIKKFFYIEITIN